MVSAVRLALLLAVAPTASATTLRQHRTGATTEVSANPIRRVVSMLQKMQGEVTAEGNKEKELYDKFMCYCKNSGGDLARSIETAKEKIESLGASLKADAEMKKQTEADLKEHKESRDEAKNTMDKATALRKKEAAAFAKEKSDSETNLAALAKAIPAIEKGMGGAFLQTTAASTVRSFAMERADLPDATRNELLAFLSGSAHQGYTPQSGEISGILKTLEDEMSKSLSDATADENAAIENYEGLMSAKSKEFESLQKQIEEEMMRLGELGAKLAGMDNDLEDTQEALAADQKFKAELKTSCSTKTSEWEEIKSTRKQELAALAETIKVLNDDDALELFKKTLPSASMSFVQVQVGRAAVQAKALTMMATARTAAKTGSMGAQPQLDLIALALRGKKIGFEKVIGMIGDMMSNLKNEQEEDNSKKQYCNKQLDQSEDKKKSLDNSISDSENAIAEMQGSIEQLTEEIAALEAGIKALDKSVAEATALRKSENADYKDLMSSDSTAKELLVFAKNRLNQFYNPKMYKPAPGRQLNEEERITVNMGGTVPTAAPGGIAGTGIGAAFVQVTAHSHDNAAPPPPPATFDAYKTKGGNGVIAMIDLLAADLDKEMQEADVAEKNAQQEYETMMADSAAKRSADSKSITQKSFEKSSTEEALETEEDTKAGTTKELMGTLKILQNLHQECDWLLQYFDVRKEARTDEISSLSNAKAVLSGADYSLLQARTSRFMA